MASHHEYPSLVPKVEACGKLETEFSEYGTRAGPCKSMTIALNSVVRNFEDIICFEDDCYPAPGAIAALRAGIDEIRDDPDIFSVKVAANLFEVSIVDAISKRFGIEQC
jgi:hypothetical protein